MRMNFKKVVYGLVLLLVLHACSSKKALVKKPEPIVPTIDSMALASDILFARVIAAKNLSDALSFSSAADYDDGKQSVNLNIEVTAKRDKYIYLNVKAMGFVNVARVMIQPDSIRILDLIHRTYISASYRYLQSFTKAPMSFEQVQNLTWANALYDPKTGATTIDSANKVLSLFTQLNGARQYVVYSAALKTERMTLREAGKDQEVQISFTNFREVDALRYPHSIVIHIQGEKKMDCKFSISNFAGSIKKEPQFVVPKTYKVQVF